MLLPCCIFSAILLAWFWRNVEAALKLPCFVPRGMAFRAGMWHDRIKISGQVIVLYFSYGETILAAGVPALQALGMTFRKAEYITDFAEKMHTGAFDLDAVAHMCDEDAIRARWLQITRIYLKEIGTMVCTCEYDSALGAITVACAGPRDL